MFKKLLAVLSLAVATILPAQQPQTVDIGPSINPIYAANAKYTNGVAPGYWPTSPSTTGLTLSLSKGTSVFAGTVYNYAGGTLTMVDGTNYVYIDRTTGMPATSTSAFTSGQFPIAIVTTASGNITVITDLRTIFTDGGASAGGGSCGPASGDTTNTDCGTNNNAGASYPSSANVTTYGNNNGADGLKKFVTAIGNSNVTENTAGTGRGEVIGIGDSNVTNFGTPISTQDVIGIGDNSVQIFAACQDCIGMGDLTLQGENGTESLTDIVAIGDVAGQGMQTGSDAMVCIGVAPCELSSTAYAVGTGPIEVIGIGDSAADDAVGSDVVAIGDSAIDGGQTRSNTGNQLVGLGYGALAANTTGSENVAIGDNAGCVACSPFSDGTGNKTGSHDIWIGDEAGQSVASSTQIDYSIAIGYHAQNDQTNETVIGSSPAAGAGATVLAIIWGNVEINGGTNVVVRCATSGALPAGALTTDATSCGTTTDTGLRVQ